MNLPLSYLEISRDALRHNVAAIRRVVGRHQQVMAVVKANAYGHGIAQVVEAIDDVVDAFQVDDIEELRELRNHTEKRALVLGYIQPSELPEAVALNAELAVYDQERLHILSEIATPESPVRIHLKVDALLGRQGLLPASLPPFLEALRRAPHVQLAGVYSHFSNLEDTSSHEHGDAQLALFEVAVEMIREAGFKHFEEHISSSAGILTYEGNRSKRPLVRLGISLYGLYPSPQLAAEYEPLELQPALRWRTSLAQVKDIPAGHPVGYGLTYIAPHPIRLGIVPQGYSDGYDRLLSSKGEVLIKSTRCPVLGRVAMNMFAVDVTQLAKVSAGDTVVLLGEEGEDRVSAEELASHSQTINYEVVARLNPLLPRLLV
ncbi:MAG TPA: alanine racemase [Verrucomicrobiae bacterium]|nr:alanine racemase [Verrucomicrobiae bacterium]